MTQAARVIDVDFSLAIHNRTGKYFIGKDILADNADRLGTVLYCRLTGGDMPPPSLIGRVAARLSDMELRRRARGAFVPLPRSRRANPVLHLDPLSTLWHDLRPCDAVLVHDVGPVTLPALFPPAVTAFYRAVYAYIAERRPICVFVSQASRAEFTALAGAAPAMSVVYPPVRFGGGAEGSAIPGITPPFLLTVGSIGARKAQARAVRAYAASGLHAQGVSYVLCGGPEEPGFAEAAAEADATPGVVRLPYVSDAQLAWLYRNAVGFVLTSLLEGFGMPVAEAMAHGLVPLVSAGSVLEEVAGPTGLSCDPTDEAAVAAAMRALIAMPEAERARRRAAMPAQLARFSRGAFRQGWASVVDAMLAAPAP